MYHVTIKLSSKFRDLVHIRPTKPRLIGDLLNILTSHFRFCFAIILYWPADVIHVVM